MSEIFIVAEHRKGLLRDITFELLQKGKELASQSGSKLTAVLLTKKADLFTARLASMADNVLVIEDDRLENFNGEIYQSILSSLIDQYKPLLVMIGHTAIGIDFAPGLAAAKNIAITTDCIDLKLDGTKLTAIRQLYNGKVSSEVSFKPAETYIATLRSGIFQFDESASGSGNIIKADCSNIADSAKKFVEYIEAVTGAVDITQADVLVSIGQGIGDAKNVPMMEDFAKALGASLSCSRPVVDRKWLPQERQVGSSGRTVKPKVYLALGISGAFQHVTAVKADVIIAVNKDPKAPIFGIADYGVVGDMFQIIPTLQEEILKLKGGK